MFANTLNFLVAATPVEHYSWPTPASAIPRPRIPLDYPSPYNPFAAQAESWTDTLAACGDWLSDPQISPLHIIFAGFLIGCAFMIGHLVQMIVYKDFKLPLIAVKPVVDTCVWVSTPPFLGSRHDANIFTRRVPRFSGHCSSPV
jgi:hypothetical protein